jgi:hypothetical protein
MFNFENEFIIFDYTEQIIFFAMQIIELVYSLLIDFVLIEDIITYIDQSRSKIPIAKTPE